jgi:glycosyltransferase involved in cell wall biosynthesis
MNKPFISIVIPTKNRVGCVNALTSDLVSLPGYDSKKIEIVVLDNATPSAQYSLPSGVRLHRHPDDIGAIKNIMSAVHFAKGEYVWILGDDDSLRIDTFEALLCLIGEHAPGLVRLKHEYITTDDILQTFSLLHDDSPACISANGYLFVIKGYDGDAIKSFEDKAGFISANIFKRDLLLDSLKICRFIVPINVYEHNVYMTKLYAMVAFYICGAYWESSNILIHQRIPISQRNFMDTGIDYFNNFVKSPAELYKYSFSLNRPLGKFLLKWHYQKGFDIRFAAANGVPFGSVILHISKGISSIGVIATISYGFRCLIAYTKIFIKKSIKGASKNRNRP